MCTCRDRKYLTHTHPLHESQKLHFETQKVKEKGIAETLEMNLQATEIHFPRAV